MDALHIILPILVGGIIGYCTNHIAIKMLFRPHKAVYVGKWKIPFTPGIIPKNQKRLAGAIGDAVSEQLLTKEAVMESLDKTGEKYITEMVERIYESDSRLLDIVPKEFEGEKILESVSASLAGSILEKASKTDFEAAIAKFISEALASLASSAPMLAMLFGPDMQNMICDKLGNTMRTYLNDRGEEALKGFILSYMQEQADKPVREIISGKLDKDRLNEALLNIMRSAFSKHGDDMLEQIDVKGIVTQRIEDMEVDELEDLVLSVMKQELQAVINLGAVIGAVIGIVNIFF